VERACSEIADTLADPGFKVSDSLVRNVERKSLLPGAKKLYCLCRAYQISPFEVYSWYGIPFERLLQDRILELPQRTALVTFDVTEALVPSFSGGDSAGVRADTTGLIEELASQWGESLAPFLLCCAQKRFLFGKVGKDDLFLYPLVLPGSLLVIDPAQREVEAYQQGSYWTRPIYFLELTNEYLFGYCERLSSDRLLLTPHADSPARAREIEVSDELTIIGRVVSIAIPGIDRLIGTP